jgi:hypothetical protein
MPARIQLKRTRGWHMPPDTVKVDRTTRFGNPFPMTAARSEAMLSPPSPVICSAVSRMSLRFSSLFAAKISLAGARSMNLAMQTFCLKQQIGPSLQ